MADFANTAAGRSTAEALVKTRMTSHAWVVGHVAIDFSGNTIVRYMLPMSPSAPTVGAWITSRDTAAA